MQIVVDIPNWLYNAILEHREPIYSQSLGDAVRDGIPLPKGHGRLFDEKDIVNGDYKIIGNKIYELEPIIEAEKGVQDAVVRNFQTTVADAIKNGTSLPKGHGALKDADEIKKEPIYIRDK